MLVLKIINISYSMMDDVSLIFPKNVKDKKEFYLYHFFFFAYMYVHFTNAQLF